jgi:hypothetical protein
VPNVTGVIIATNHKTDGIFLPTDDRCHFVAWSELDREDFPEAYWNALWRWYLSGGLDHVAAYLRSWTCPCSTRRRRRRRRMHSWQSSMRTMRRKTPSSRTCWTASRRPRDRRKGVARCGDAA